MRSCGTAMEAWAIGPEHMNEQELIIYIDVRSAALRYEHDVILTTQRKLTMYNSLERCS